MVKVLESTHFELISLSGLDSHKAICVIRIAIYVVLMYHVLSYVTGLILISSFVIEG